MAVTSEYELRLGMRFSDATERTYAIGIDSITAGDPTSVKTRIAEVKNGTGTGGAYTAATKATFVSDEGNPMVEIATAKIVITESEVIYSG